VKRVYYLSLEFLMRRSLANNIPNLMLDPVWRQLCKKHKIDPRDCGYRLRSALRVRRKPDQHAAPLVRGHTGLL
jgi:hypothetical protein